jgi:hypothetical protein
MRRRCCEDPRPARRVSDLRFASSSERSALTLTSRPVFLRTTYCSPTSAPTSTVASRSSTRRTMWPLTQNGSSSRPRLGRVAAREAGPFGFAIPPGGASSSVSVWIAARCPAGLDNRVPRVPLASAWRDFLTDSFLACEALVTATAHPPAGRHLSTIRSSATTADPWRPSGPTLRPARVDSLDLLVVPRKTRGKSAKMRQRASESNSDTEPLHATM